MGITISEREDSQGRASIETRYYILSQQLPVREFAEAVRGHWSVENNLHWQLDVSFGEDRSRTRKDHAAANLGGLRRTALSLLKNETSEKVGISNRRLIAAWNTDYLRKVLFGA